MEQPLFDNTTKAGTSTGTLLILLANITSEDLIKTAMLAALGAVVSFCISTALKQLVIVLKNRWRQKW